MLFDVVPIAVFIYGYFLLALRRFFCLGALVSTAITLLFAAGSYFVGNYPPPFLWGGFCGFRPVCRGLSGRGLRP
jgi:hypothetical protein